MSPAAQTIAEIDQYFDNSLRVRGPNNNSYQRQGTRQFQNSHTRIINNFPCETVFGKPTFVNGSRSPKFNLGYSRPVNFVDLHAQNGWTNMQQQQQQSMSPIHTNQRRYHQYNVNNPHCPKPRKEFAPQNEINRQPFTRMPGNCQTSQLSYPGVKLNTIPRNKLNFNRNNQKLYKHADKSEGSKQSLNKESPGRASDAVSNASDESSGQSENSLPRIIKPRKRRKKDRKPAVDAVETTPVIATAVTPKIVNPPMNMQTKTSVTLDSSSSAIDMLTKTSVTLDSSSSAINMPIQKRAISSVSSTPPIQQAHKPDTAAKDETVSPFIADSFVNLILDEDKQIAHTPTILDKIVVTKQDEEPSSVCQCRYCDPCGEIWDVEQRCYSPFLTPPSPNEPKLFINSIRSVLTGSIAKSNGSSYLLRRSWSEPSESSLMTVRSRNKSDSYEPSSHDLQVSSEIITSPNGHRDIEIKFFSTPKRYSTDLQKHTVPFSNLTPPLSPWKKDVRFGDLFTLPNTIRPTINVSL